MRFKELRILPNVNAKRTLRAFFAGIGERCLVRVTMPHSGSALKERTFHYLAENGYGRRLKFTDEFCPECCDVRTPEQIQACRSVRDTLDSFCRLCGCEVWGLHQLDGSTRSSFGAISHYHFSTLTKDRRKVSKIMFFKGAKIFQPSPALSEHDERSA